MIRASWHPRAADLENAIGVDRSTIHRRLTGQLCMATVWTVWMATVWTVWLRREERT